MDFWYVFYSKPRLERHLAEELRQKQVEVYLPLLPEPGHASRSPAPHLLFPRYLFGRFNGSAVTLDAIRWTPGLVAVVSFGGEPARVDDSVIAFIRERLAPLAASGTAVPFEPGRRVRLPADHPLAALDAVFEKPLSDGQRAHVLVSILGRLTRCEVAVACLEPVDGRRWPFG